MDAGNLFHVGMVRAPRKYFLWTSPGPVASENGQALIFFRPALIFFPDKHRFRFLSG